MTEWDASTANEAGTVPVHRSIPVPDEVSRPFWEYAGRKVLAVQCCLGCGHKQHPPVLLCPRCSSVSLEFRPVSGNAKLISWTEVRHPFVAGWLDHLPFTSFVVELNDCPGVYMVSDDVYFLRKDGSTLPTTQGLPMTVRFEPLSRDPWWLPQFVPQALDR